MNGRASSLALQSVFLVVLDHSAMPQSARQRVSKRENRRAKKFHVKLIVVIVVVVVVVVVVPP